MSVGRGIPLHNDPLALHRLVPETEAADVAWVEDNLLGLECGGAVFSGSQVIKHGAGLSPRALLFSNHILMQDVALARLVSANSQRANTFSISQSQTKVTFGRSKENDVVILDPRISAKHCILHVETEGEAVKFSVEDTSSNGTFVNGVRVVKPEVKAVDDRDNISLMNPKNVTADDVITFTLCVMPVKRIREKSPEPQPTKKLKATDASMLEDLTCVVCLEIMHQPVSLLPCLHAVKPN